LEDVSVLLKTPQVRVEQAKCTYGIPCFRAGSVQTDYPTFLPLRNALRLGDVLLGATRLFPKFDILGDFLLP
jgi:hypothetical protein